MKARLFNNVILDRDRYSTRLELHMLKRNMVFYIGNDPGLVTFGMVNETADNYFVPFIDYDNIHYEKVVKDIRHIQRVFGLNSMVVICNSESEDANGDLYGNYGVIGFDKLTYQEHLEMLCHTRCDRNYVHCPKFYKQKNWVLRFEEKVLIANGKVHRDRPAYKTTITSFNDLRQCSYAHYLMARKLLNIPKMKLKWDGIRECELIPYRTGIK